MVEVYINVVKMKSDLECIEFVKEKIGVFIGVYVVNLVNGEKLLIWIVDYVFVIYGIGVVMVVLVYDECDYEFVLVFNFLMKEVVKGGDIMKEVYIGDGVYVNLVFFDGLNKEEVIVKMIEWFEVMSVGN